MDGPVQSPIPWPRSDKKRKPSSFTPNNRDATNKLSSKKSSGRKVEEDTPRRSFSKWLKPSRSSIDTFNRLYNEMTNSPTDRLSFGSREGGSTESLKQLRNSKSNSAFSPTTAQNDKSSARLKGQILKNIILLDSDSESCDNSISSSSVASISRKFRSLSVQKNGSDLPTGSSKKHKQLLDSSSDDDDDSFCLPPPLHQRIPLVSTDNSLNKETPNYKTKPVKSFGKTTGKENELSLNKNREKPIVIDDSSSGDDLPTIPTTSLDNRKTSLPVLHHKTPTLGFNRPVIPKECTSTRKGTGKPVIVDSSSSEDELLGIPKSKALVGGSSYNQLPDLPTASSKSINPSLLRTEPKSFKPKSILSTPQALTSHIRKASLSSSSLSSSSDYELPNLIKTDPNKSRRKVKNIIFDSSSESELPDIQKVTTSEKGIPKKLFTASPLPKAVSSTSQVASSPTQTGTPKLWLSQESLKESSRFLKSLSDKVPVEHISANFRKQFSKHKEDLVKKLYKIFNESVFEKKLPADMSITWNIRLTKTAGYCYMRSHKDLSRTARIELSVKVLDSAERVRDTLLHEMCHAAAFIIHGYRDGHGPLFKFWGQKAGVLFPFLPVVSRCHTYRINTKYVYRCTRCNASIGRHSRSLDMSRKVCGCCGGRFELLVNGVVQQSSQKETSGFAKFVKENYKKLKDANRTMKHGDIMQKLGVMFAEKAKI